MVLYFPKRYHIRTASSDNLQFDDYLIYEKLEKMRKDLSKLSYDMNKEEHGKKYDCIASLKYAVYRVYDNDGKTKYVLFDNNGKPLYIERIEHMQIIDKMFVDINSNKMYVKNMLHENAFATLFLLGILVGNNPRFAIKYKMICLQDIFRFVFTGRRRY